MDPKGLTRKNIKPILFGTNNKIKTDYQQKSLTTVALFTKVVSLNGVVKTRKIGGDYPHGGRYLYLSAIPFYV